VMTRNARMKEKGAPILRELEKKRILILGMGREGISTYEFLRSRFPDKKLAVADKNDLEHLDKQFTHDLEKDTRVEIFTGRDYMKRVVNFDVVFKTPGIPYTIYEIQEAAKHNSIYSNTSLFFDIFGGSIIGITGTKGKSTTTRLIFDVLSAGGIKTKLMGNIGIPPLSVLDDVSPDTIVVTELSSHQLYDMKRSPHIAVLQGIFQEHLDYYKDFAEYVSAKSNITRFQDAEDYLIYNHDNQISSDIANASKAIKLSFGLENDPTLNCFFDQGWLSVNFNSAVERIHNSTNLKLMGRFNLVNVMPAILIGKLLEIPSTRIRYAIESFRPLEHRLEFVAESKTGVRFINDSLSTTPESAINAIEAFPPKSVILLTGGYDRKQNFHLLARKIFERGVRALLLFPTTGSRIWEEVKKLDMDKPQIFHREVSTMEDAVVEALNISESGNVVLMSPASASFNQFIDYRDRGDQFKSLVLRELEERGLLNPPV
jgi:UDP-N-acetylmuramoylalanine--D-glutamate ligase